MSLLLSRNPRLSRVVWLILVFATLALAFGLLFATPGAIAQEDDGQEVTTHMVVPGETLYGIAARYGVSIESIAEANGISNYDLLPSGRPLIIPAPPGQTGRVHIVQRGQNLSRIAAIYGIPVEEIVLANDLPNPNYIFAGQRLLIPVAGETVEDDEAGTETPDASTEEATEERVEETATPSSTEEAMVETAEETATPSPTVTLTPTVLVTTTPPLAQPMLPGIQDGTSACPAGCEVISIFSPTVGMAVTSPVTVTGIGTSSFEQILVVRVVDATGLEIGRGSAIISGTNGQPGMYTAAISYTVPIATQAGRIQVYSIGPRDGAIEHLTSVEVRLQGSGLDLAVEDLKTALEDKDYQALETLIVEPWVLGFYQSEGVVLGPEAALSQLEENYLGPGEVSVDLSVDALQLLSEQVIFSQDVSHVVYSTGWGPDQVDDAFLLLVSTDDGRTGWGGMLYVFDGLRDYEVP